MNSFISSKGNGSLNSSYKKIHEKIVIALATGCGLGFAPKAPGTFGSLAGIPLGLWLLQQSITEQFLVLAILTAIAIWVIHQVESIWQTHDDKKIVIDEIVGQAIALCGSDGSPKQIFIAFLLFRFFDILKPGPIGLLDRKLKSAAGTLLDDILAGVAAACVLALIQKIF